MNTAKRVRLFLTPVLIAMLAIMLAVVSFGWYQATASGEITVTDSSVSITVEEPEGIDVSYTQLGDEYEYTYSQVSASYSIIDKGHIDGYFGQTGEYNVESANNDKPYIIFFKLGFVTTYDRINLESAYVDSISITKGNETLLEEQEFTKDNSKFKIYFYSSDDEGSTLKNESNTFTYTEGVDIYMGIHFDSNNNPQQIEDRVIFEYSDIKYYGASYNLGITFVEKES